MVLRNYELHFFFQDLIRKLKNEHFLKFFISMIRADVW